MRNLILFFILLTPLFAGCVPITPPPASGASQEVAPVVSQEEITTALDAYLQDAAAAGFSGSVFIERAGQVLLANGYGLANRATGIPNSQDTLFDIGSITKMFTAIAILQLESAGQLSTADPLTHYFEDVPADKAAITLDQILFHNAGLVDFIAGDDFTAIGKAEAVRAILDAPLLFAPGEEWSYSNAGYTLLAAIIEQVSGEPYTTYMDQHIFELAGMINTSFYGEQGWSADQVAHGYVNGRDTDSPLQWPGPYWGIMGNGGIVSTAVEMGRWNEALQTGILLDDAAIEKLYTPRLTIQEYEGGIFYEIYGGGLSVRADGSRVILTTGGNDYGFVADYLHYLDDELTIIVLTNSEEISAPMLGRELVHILRGETPADPATLQAPTR